MLVMVLLVGFIWEFSSGDWWLREKWGQSSVFVRALIKMSLDRTLSGSRLKRKVSLGKSKVS